MRIKYLLENNIKPEHILVTAFNVLAAEHLTNKINLIVKDKEKVAKMEIANIDKFAKEQCIKHIYDEKDN